MDKTVIDILSHQAAFIASDKIHTAIVGGFRSGKSHAGVLKTIKKKTEHPGIPVAYYLPTYGLIRDVAYPKFSEMLDLIGIPKQLNKSDHEFLTPYGRIIFRSMDNPDTIVGYETVYGCADEIDILSTDHARDAFVKMVARNSVLVNGKDNSFDFVSTPEGFKFLYDFFIKDASNPNKHLIQAKTDGNPFISEGYIKTLSMSYTPEQLQAYLNGEFVNLTSGNVYHHFDRKENHTDRTVKDGEVLHIGMDFNVTKMNAVINVFDGKIRSAVAEIVNAYDTPQMIELIKERFPKHQIVVYPDASGDNRKSSGKSDIELLRQAGFTVRKPSKNPFVKDRVNSMNMALKSTSGERTLFVNTNNCPALTEALEKQTYKNGEPDKTSGFDHITEAEGYFIHGQSKAIEVRSTSAPSIRDRYK